VTLHLVEHRFVDKDERFDLIAWPRGAFAARYQVGDFIITDEVVYAVRAIFHKDADTYFVVEAVTHWSPSFSTQGEPVYEIRKVANAFLRDAT
jgi:hypothetical protein